MTVGEQGEGGEGFYIAQRGRGPIYSYLGGTFGAVFDIPVHAA